jgi:tryptophanyl-tRNA synthetase
MNRPFLTDSTTNIWEIQGYMTQEIQECILSEGILEKISRGEPIVIYWGTATTSPPHLAYFIPILRLVHLAYLSRNVKIKILLADIHSFMDKGSDHAGRYALRTEVYRMIITNMLNIINAPLDQFEFIVGSSYQLEPSYTLDLYRLASLVTERQAHRATADVVKMGKNFPLSNLMYPLMQILDVPYLGADLELGGIDQRKIFMLQRDLNHETKCNELFGDRLQCSFLMNSIMGGLDGKENKMSASGSTKNILQFSDDLETINRKMLKAFCPEAGPNCPDGKDPVMDNPIIGVYEKIVHPVLRHIKIEKPSIYNAMTVPKNAVPLNLSKKERIIFFLLFIGAMFIVYKEVTNQRTEPGTKVVPADCVCKCDTPLPVRDANIKYFTVTAHDDKEIEFTALPMDTSADTPDII